MVRQGALPHRHRRAPRPSAWPAAAALLAALPPLAAGQDVLQGPAAEDRRLVGFGTLTADPSNPTFGSGSMSGMSGSYPGAMPLLTPSQSMSVSQQSQAILRGMIPAFLGEANLNPQEMTCITQGAPPIGGNVARVAAQIALIVKQGFGPNMDIPGMTDTPEEIAEEQAKAQKAASKAGMPSFDVPGWGEGGGLQMSSGSGGDGDISSMVDRLVAQQKAAAATKTRSAPAPAPPASASATGAGASGSLALPQATGSLASSQAAQLTALQGQAQGQTTQVQAAKVADAKAQNSLSFFYGDRRLQLLPANPEPEPEMGGGFMGGGMGAGMASFPVAMELGFSIKQITEETHELMGSCIHSNARAAFLQAGNNMKNLKYVTGHFLANGADVVQELADAVVHYKQQNLTGMGSDIGMMLRKVFFSNSSNNRLPEGMPGDKQLAKVTTGLMKGFFGPGASALVTFDRAPKNPLRVNMNKCVSKNSDFFQMVWADVMYLYGQEVAKGKGSMSSDEANQAKTQFAMTVGLTMMQVPGALKKCNIDDEHKSLIMAAIKDFGMGIHFKVTLPSGTTDNGEMSKALAQTVQFWTNKKWSKFGIGLGQLLQKSMVKFHPQLYSVDEAGNLQRRLLHLEGAAASRLGLRGGVGRAALLPTVFGAAVFLLAAGLLALKSRRAMQSFAGTSRSSHRCEQRRFDIEATVPLGPERHCGDEEYEEEVE